jgi:hypothetical protein
MLRQGQVPDLDGKAAEDTPPYSASARDEQPSSGSRLVRCQCVALAGRVTG